MDFSALENLLINTEKEESDEVSRKVEIVRSGQTHIIEIRFKKLTYSRYSYLRKASTKIKKGSPDFDIDKYRISIITDTLLDPCLGKRELMEKIGAVTPEQALGKLFLAGEIVKICDLILEESGFQTDPFRDSVSDDEDSSGEE